MAESMDQNLDSTSQPPSEDVSPENGNSWFNYNSWINTAKEKSAEVFGYIRQDLNELTQTVHTEATSVASAFKEGLKLTEETSTTTVKSMASSVSTLFGQVSNQVSSAFKILPDSDEEEVETLVVNNQQPLFTNRLEAAIYSLSLDPQTFLTDPEESMQEYEKWIETFNWEKKEAELPDVMADNTKLLNQYQLLVPSMVSHAVFWHRYFYRVEQLISMSMTPTKEPQKVEPSPSPSKQGEKMIMEDDIQWDEDEDFGGTIDIPEDLQQQLLSEYEKECNANKKVKDILPSDKGSKHLEPMSTSLGLQLEKEDISVNSSEDMNRISCESVAASSSQKSISSGSNDDEWVQEFDVTEEERDLKDTNSLISNATNKTDDLNAENSPEDSDWEKWGE